MDSALRVRAVFTKSPNSQGADGDPAGICHRSEQGLPLTNQLVCISEILLGVKHSVYKELVKRTTSSAHQKLSCNYSCTTY